MYILSDILEKTNCVKSDLSVRSLVLGLIVQELGANPKCQFRRISNVVEVIFRGINTDQIALFFDHTGKFTGYVCWAYVSNAVEKELIMNPAFSPSEQEIVGGESLWILDFYSVPGQSKKILDVLQNRVLSTAAYVSYFRIKSKKRIAKRVKIS